MKRVARPQGLRWLVTALLLAAGMVALASRAEACDTPVYRYALYRWQPHPYVFFYFYRDEIPAADLAVHKKFQELSGASGRRLNAEVLAIDVADEKLLAETPKDVREWFAAQEDLGLPRYHVYTAPRIDAPLGARWYAGPIDEPRLEAMIDSPKLRAVNEILSGRQSGLLLMLTGAKAEQNVEARAVLNGLAGDLSSGKLEAPPNFDRNTNPSPAAAETQEPPVAKKDVTAAESDKASTPRLPFGPGVLELDRNDPREKWLIQSLLSVEGDLLDFDEPMIFPVFGRGRVGPPFIGNGITQDNLVSAVYFLTGVCSCEVKDEVPGIDLLTYWNWDNAALSLAEFIGEEEGNERLMFNAEDIRAAAQQDPPLAEFPTVAVVPEQSAPGEEPSATQPQNNVGPSTTEPSDTAATPPSNEVALASEPGGRASSLLKPLTRDRTPVEPIPDVQVTESEVSSRLVKRIGIGVGAALLGILIVGLLLFRSPGRET